MAAAHMGMQSRDDHSLHTKFLQQDVKIGLEEAAVTAFGHHIVLFAEIQLGNHLSPLCTGDGVVAPDEELTVDAWQVGIIAEDDRNTGLACSIKQLSCGGNDGTAAVAAQCTSDKVVQHVDDQNGGFLKFFHFSFVTLIDVHV